MSFPLGPQLRRRSNRKRTIDRAATARPAPSLAGTNLRRLVQAAAAAPKPCPGGDSVMILWRLTPPSGATLTSTATAPEFAAAAYGKRPRHGSAAPASTARRAPSRSPVAAAPGAPGDAWLAELEPAAGSPFVPTSTSPVAAPSATTGTSGLATLVRGRARRVAARGFVDTDGPCMPSPTPGFGRRISSAVWTGSATVITLNPSSSGDGALTDAPAAPASTAACNPTAARAQRAIPPAWSGRLQLPAGAMKQGSRADLSGMFPNHVRLDNRPRDPSSPTFD